MNIQCDQVTEARRPDIVFINKEETEVKIIDVAVPGDMRVIDKMLENMEKYQLLKDEIGRLWNMKKVRVIPIVVDALRLVSKVLRTFSSSEKKFFPKMYHIL